MNIFNESSFEWDESKNKLNLEKHGPKKLELLVLVFGAKGKKFMKKKIKYTNESLGNVEIVRDFLPKPSELVLKENNIKVTLNLSKTSIEFFKKIANKHGIQYQKVIRNLLDHYTRVYSE